MSVAHPTYFNGQRLNNLSNSKINYKAYYQDTILFGVNATTGDTPTPPTPIYKWEADGTTCVGYDLYYMEYEWVSYDNGTTWSETGQERVGSLIEANSTDCGYVPPHDYSQDYFTMVSRGSGNFMFYSNSSPNKLQYSTDGGTTWSTASNNITVSVSNGSTVLFKGTASPQATAGIGTFSASTIAFDVEGNIMSLMYGDNFTNQKDLTGKDWAFGQMFRQSKVVSAENLILPATTLAASAYTYMFYNATGLTSAPTLPAQTLTDSCYRYMFQGCSRLTQAANMSATTVASNCCYNMYANCFALASAQSVLPSTTMAYRCYYQMFFGCSGLTTAPTLPSETLVEECYYHMFTGCSHLNYITMLATDVSATNCLTDWVSGVAASGTFVKNPNMSSLPSGSSGIPNGWTVQDYSSS